MDVIRTILADTGPLYALVNDRDQYHARATAELNRLRASGTSVEVLVPNLEEAYSLLLYRHSSSRARDWLREMLTGTSLIVPRIDDYRLAATVLDRFHDQSLTLVDAVLFVVSSDLQFPIWTYDHHFDVLRANRWYPTA